MRLKPLQRQALAIGICVTILQLALAFWLSPEHHPSEVYSRLCKWDCGWYSSIAHDGYHSPVPPVAQKAEISNVAFFPAFPYLARIVSWGFRIKPEISLVVIAQIFAVLFWSALWMILQRWKISPQGATLVFLAVLAHPATFFLIAGYSESLFLASLLIFILCTKTATSKAGARPSVSGSVAGITMSATRIVGMPVAFFPLMISLSKNIGKRGAISLKTISHVALKSLATSMIACLGAIGFLLYCQIRFGRYDLYMETQRIGWGITPDYSAIFKWKHFTYSLGYDRVSTLASGIAFLTLAVFELILWLLKKNRGLSTRIPLYGISALIFFITVSGLKSLKFRSMIRYTLPWHVLLILCLAHLISRNFKHSSNIFNLCVILGILLTALSIRWLGAPHIIDFLNSRWFA